MGSNSNNNQTHHHNTSSTNAPPHSREHGCYPSQHDRYPRASYHPSWQSAQASASSQYPYIERSAAQSTGVRTRLASTREDGYYSQPAKRARANSTSVSLLKQLTRALNSFAKEVAEPTEHPVNKKERFIQ